MANPQYEHFKNFSGNTMSMEEKREVWLSISDMTPEAFDAMMAEHQARNANVPEVGDAAPDFRIERITPDRKRTGDFVELSSLRGKSVALLFGSYT